MLVYILVYKNHQQNKNPLLVSQFFEFKVCPHRTIRINILLQCTRLDLTVVSNFLNYNKLLGKDFYINYKVHVFSICN